MTTQNVLWMDRDSIADFQHEMYKGSQRNPDVGSHFSYNLIQKAHAPKIKVKMDMTPGGDGEYIYTASKKYDVLLNLEAHINLYPIKVKDVYSKSVDISYHHNLGHSILQQGELKIDDDHIQTIDTIYNDTYSQFYVTKRNSYKRMIGSLPCLEEWSKELPAIPLIVPQHFYFTRNTRVGLAIWKGNNKITFEYKMQTKLVDLLRMRVKNKHGEWKEIRPNLKYLEVKNDVIPVPELWGIYAEMTDEERNWRKSINPNTKEPEKLIIYTEDVDMTCSTNLTPIGSKVKIPLESTFPAKNIFWVAQIENGIKSNYTSNRYNVYKGFNPCGSSAIKYGGNDRVPDVSHVHFDLSEPYYFFPGEPSEDGYNAFTFQLHPNLIQTADNAVILKKCGASLEVTLGDTNPFSQPEEDKEYQDDNGDFVPVEALEDDDDKMKRDKYTVHVRTVVMKKMEVFWSDKDNALKYIFV